MILIAHRGNISGPNPEFENNYDYLLRTLKAGYDIEVDVWYVDNKYYLGHDEPQYQIEEEFLIDNRIWCHAKHIQSFDKMLKNGNIHCFFHQRDDYTLTSKNIIWTLPGKLLTNQSISVMPEITDTYSTKLIDYSCYGICSDYVGIFY
jgi:hypothetical protein